jgi:hypothetical protein
MNIINSPYCTHSYDIIYNFMNKYVCTFFFSKFRLILQIENIKICKKYIVMVNIKS